MSGHEAAAGAAAVGFETSWADALEEQFGQVPWWLVSSIMHVLLLAVLSLVVTSRPEKDLAAVIQGDFVTSPPEIEPVALPLTEPAPVLNPDDVFTSEPTVEFKNKDDEATEDPGEVEHDARRDSGKVEDIDTFDMHNLASVARLGLGAGRLEGSHGVWKGRGERRKKMAHGDAGLRRQLSAVDRALKWLARHQEPDGRWDAEKYGGQRTDVGVTGLALLAFLGAGYDEFHRTEYRDTVKRGVTWLVSKQDPDGAIGRGYASGLGYHHALAGLALAEAYGMGERERTRRAAQRAVDYSTKVHQCPGSGWRYRAAQDADMSVTGWFVMQLKSSTIAGLEVDPAGFKGAVAFLDSCTDREGHYPGRVSYKPESGPSAPMTAVGLVCRIFMGWRRHDPLVTGAVQHIMRNPARWEGERGGVDFYYWYYAMLGLFQVGGQEWNVWGKPACDLFVEHQRRGGPEVDGSWDPVGKWGARGGRVYSTALAALSLEVYYRYPSVFGAARTR